MVNVGGADFAGVQLNRGEKGNYTLHNNYR
jgi:hypothetical protein